MNEGLYLTGFDYDLLQQHQKALYLDEAVGVAADAFGQNKHEAEFIDDVRHHLTGHRVIMAYDYGSPVGFVSLKYFGDKGGVMYVSGMAVRGEYQARGVGGRLAVNGMRMCEDSGDTIRYIAGRTQNPAVAKARRKYCPVVYPITQSPDRHVYSVAGMLHSDLRMTGNVDRRTLVCRDVYSRPLSSRRIRSGDAAVDTFFERHVGPTDAVFIIGKPNLQ